MTPQYLTIPGPNGYDISLKQWLSEDGGPAPVLLCLHGFAGDKESSVIAAVAEAMCRKGFRVVTFDWPGHGKSPADSSFLTVENCLRDLERVSSWCGAPLSCFATSFGGFLAVLYLGRHPGCFDRLLLRSPALRMARVLKSFLTDEQLAAFRAGTKLDFGFTRPLLLDGSFLADLERPDHDAYAVPAGAKGQPAAVIHGDADDVVPVGDSLSFAERNHLPVRIVHGADHRYKNPGELEQIVAFAGEFLGTGCGT